MIRQLAPAPYSTTEAAYVLGVSTDVILALIHRGELKGAFRSGARLFKVPVEAVSAYIERQSIAAP